MNLTRSLTKFTFKSLQTYKLHVYKWDQSELKKALKHKSNEYSKQEFHHHSVATQYTKRIKIATSYYLCLS